MVFNKLTAIFGHYLILFIFLSFTGVQLEFNSHLTGDPRSIEIADDNSTSEHEKATPAVLRIESHIQTHCFIVYFINIGCTNKQKIASEMPIPHSLGK